MNHGLKRLSIIIAVQFVCVGVGLWVHQQFVRSLSNGTAGDRAWAQLQAASDPIPDEALNSDLEALNLGELQKRLKERAPQQSWQLAVMDAQWHLLRDTQFSTRLGGPPLSVAWKPIAPARIEGRLPFRGMLEYPDGSHVATAFPLTKHRGYIVAHVPVAAIQTTTDALLGALPTSGVIAFVWTCTLIGIVSYMIGTRVNESFCTTHKQTNTESLQKAQSLVRTQDAVIFGLAKLAESRDPDTGLHLERISMYATTLAQALRHRPKYRDVVNAEFIRLIGIGSALHDIGKVGIRDSILLKPGLLTTAERAEIQKHAAIGAECLLKIEERLGASNFLQMARSIARSHHERWDGSGYPDNRLGKEIPLAARIVSIADVYDALATRRVYKPDLPHAACVGFIQRGAGTQFDPDLVDVFMEVEQQFRRIAEQNSDIIKPKAGADGEEIWQDEFIDVELTEELADAVEMASSRD